jgi:uncharacterized protein (TIGR02217 family)
MSNAIFPTLVGLDWGVQRIPKYSTRIQTAISGKELRAAYWSYPMYTFKLKYNVVRDMVAHAELKSILGFFLARQGMYDSFLFEDPDDNTITDQGIGTGDGTTRAFQLVRSYGGWVEPVQNVHAITNIKIAGVATGAYTVSSTGLVTFTVAPANGTALTWTGTYYYRCRFLNDTAEFSKFMNNLWEYKSCNFIGALGNKV